jgi:hypothetical protein
MKNPKNTSPNFHHRAWTPNDDLTLRSLLERGNDGETISRVLGRTRASIINRRFILGNLPRMKRSPNGTKAPYSFKTGKHQRVTVAPVLQEVQLLAPPVKEKKTRQVTKVTKTSPAPVSKNYYQQAQESYTSKLVFGVKRLNRGDITKISRQLKMAKPKVSRILAGMEKSEAVIDLLYQITQGRETLYQQLTNLISSNRG